MRRHVQPLATRQLEVLRDIADGYRNKEIANRLGISERTVKHHVTRINAILETDNRAHAAAVAIRRGHIK